MQKIVPHLWFDQNIREAAEFYTSAFPNSQASTGVAHPETGDPITAELEIDGYKIALINGGPDAKPTPAMSFFVNFDPSTMENPREELQLLWDKLTQDGTVLMDLGEYAFSEFYGWVADRYGYNWQLMLTNPEGDPRPFIVPNLMFCGPAQGKAAEATDDYIAIFDDAQLGNRVTYGAMGAAGTDSPDTIPQQHHVVFSDFQLMDQWFSAMDSGVEQPFTFSMATSFMIIVKDQEELDRYWDALSAVPEKEVCGWLEDKYGVSWQIAPENLEELLARPQGFENMMKMKKLIIDDF